MVIGTLPFLDNHVVTVMRLRKLQVTLLVMATLLGGAAVARAQSYALPDADRHFRLEWEAGQSAKRGPVITGYVYETSGRLADTMRLAIEAVDPAGNVTGTTLGYVPGTIPGGGRAYFEISVPAASAYRVRILSFRWLLIGGG